MSDDDRERLVAEIDSRLKERARADPRPIREVVEDCLQQEFATGETAAIERRIEEKKQRIQTLEREINEREREKAEEEATLTRLEERLETMQTTEQDLLADARETLETIPHEPDNPAVVNWAKKLDMTPTELLDRL